MVETIILHRKSLILSCACVMVEAGLIPPEYSQRAIEDLEESNPHTLIIILLQAHQAREEIIREFGHCLSFSVFDMRDIWSN